MGAPAAVCPTCQGDRTDPDDPGDYDHAVHMHDPYSRGPCPTCNGTGLRDFGHVTMDVITNGRFRTVECYRCRFIPWPCASAVVLGLTPTT